VVLEVRTYADVYKLRVPPPPEVLVKREGGGDLPGPSLPVQRDSLPPVGVHSLVVAGATQGD